MYIVDIQIQNIRSLRQVNWDIDVHQAAGWHVILGDNGSGKSSFTRAVSLALVGPAEAKALRQDWNEWLRKDQQKGSIRLNLDPHLNVDQFSGRGAIPKNYYLSAGLNLTRQSDNSMTLTAMSTQFKPDRFIWGGKGGWFSAAYGPFRRFSGGDKDYEKIFYSNPRLAPHLSAFGENVALTESIQWLQELRFKQLENNPEGKLLDQIRNFVNQPGFLPHEARLASVSSKSVEFVDGNNCKIPVEELSDGYRSILSMTFELIRQMKRAYPETNIFSRDGAKITKPGVVLIDEVDAHLHPSWQKRIGLWFREHFPQIQFIVTTHSPLVCQAADVGTVWRLPSPGSSEQAGMVTGTDLDRLLYGNILDAYSTDLFGTGATRSAEAQKRLERLAELNMFELDRELSTEERSELQTLRATMPTSAHTLQSATNGKK
jgi:predicted ATPase